MIGFANPLFKFKFKLQNRKYFNFGHIEENV